MAFLEALHLDGRLFDGGWSPARVAHPAIEPATGATLAQVGEADAAAVAEAARTASAAQRAWAQAAPAERARVLAAAAEAARANHAEIVTWIMRESGSVRAKAEFELSITVKALELAAAMPEQAQGLVLPSEAGKLSLARRRPSASWA